MQTNNKKWNSFPFIEINNKIFSVKKRIISIEALPFHFSNYECYDCYIIFYS